MFVYFQDPATRMHDLEDTVLSLRRQLEEKDRDIEIMRSPVKAVNGDSRDNSKPVLSMSEVSNDVSM